MKEIKLGQNVRDRVTGFAGIATGRSEFITGCTRIGVTPKVGKDGKLIEAEWFDEPMLEVIGKARVTPKLVGNKSEDDGGPLSSIPKRSANPK